MSVVIHPDVQRALDYADALKERLYTYRDKMTALTGERVSKDGDIAVKVDLSGQLIDLWLKPGLLDNKSPAAIAREITEMVTEVGADVAGQVGELYREAHDIADIDTLVGPARAISDAGP
ncbi:hypothetical protein [Mycolicibacterium sp. XJ870]